MHKIILGITLSILLSACSTTAWVGGIAALQTADTAKHSLATYLGDDEQANEQVKIPLEALTAILEQAKKADSAMAMYEFVLDNGWMIKSGKQYYAAIVDTVNQHYKRTGIKPPAELLTYDADVRAAYEGIIKAIARRDRTVKVAEYIALLTKILAARQGIIVS